MQFFRLRFFLLPLILTIPAALTHAQTAAKSTSGSKSNSQKRREVGHPGLEIDDGSVSNGVYRNKSLGFACKIPPGWVLRTEEMNAPEEEEAESMSSENEDPHISQRRGDVGHPAKVLLAAFSRPPEAAGEDVNSSIVIAAESAAAYPGLKEAAQYLEPVEEAAKAQGFAVTREPYEIAVGAKALAREDFQKDVGSRVLRQSTLVMLARGYAVSFTFIGGTEAEVEELLDGLSFGATKAVK